MAERPLIGLPGRRKTGESIKGFPPVLADSQLDLYFAAYARGVLEAGGLPVHLPFDAPPAAYVEPLDAVLLTGGADLDPSLYDAESETDLFPPEPQRDNFELDLLDASAEADLPVLGICRGLQLLNVHAGGSLHQDVPAHSRFDVVPETLTHSVALEADSEIGQLYDKPTIEVNSLHHQTVDRLGDGFRVTAMSPDGTVEAIESLSRPWIAVQWHPEMMTSRPTDPLFSWLVERAKQ